MQMETSSLSIGASVAVNTTVVNLPKWVINLHHFRKSLFLQTVEPIIVFLLGPMEDESISQLTDEAYPLAYGASASGASASISSMEQIASFENHRRLGYMPNYVEDVGSFRETSMSFATLAMMFTIMTCVLLIFLSCFYHNQKTAPLFASPRRHRLPKLVPPPLPVDGTFSWIKVCFYMSDEEVSSIVSIM